MDVRARVAGEAVTALPLLHNEAVPAARAEQQHCSAPTLCGAAEVQAPNLKPSPFLRYGQPAIGNTFPVCPSLHEDFRGQLVGVSFPFTRDSE